MRQLPTRRLAVLFLLYTLPALLALELVARRGYYPLQSSLSKNNDVFTGILDSCISDQDRQSKSNSILPPTTSSINCIQGQFRSVLNIKPNYTTRFFGKEFNVEIQTDEDGFRLPNGNLNSKILVMGDSFTYGHGVEGDQRFSQILAGMCRTSVLNASYMNGFAPEHYRYWLDANNMISPDFIVVNLFVSNDLDSDVRETILSTISNRKTIELRSRQVLHSGQLASRYDANGPLQKLILLSAQHFAIGNLILTKTRKFTSLFGRYPLPNARMSSALASTGSINFDILQRTADAINQIQKIATSRNPNAKVIVAVIPDSLTDLNIQRMMKVNASIIDQLSVHTDNISFLDLAPALNSSHFFVGDRHYNSQGHMAHAQRLMSKINSLDNSICQ